MEKPTQKPDCANFSSGPCAKRPGWSAAAFGADTLGRSHRSGVGKKRIQELLAKTRAILGVPADYQVGIVPASDTGAYEMAMWSLLGERPVTALAWESFGDGWVTDAVKQLKLDPVVMTAPYGELPDLGAVDQSHDVLFTWNGTTSGARVPNGDWIADDRGGLTLCDATSAAYAQDLPWAKLDVVTYSWQKVLGGEAQHGMLILGPRAVARLESYTPPWPLPKIFRLTKNGKLNASIFDGATINTPSMLCVEDHIDALNWAESIGGLHALHAKADENLAVVANWVSRTPWIDFLVKDAAIRSNTSVCLSFSDSRFLALSLVDQYAFVKRIEKTLEAERAAYDFAGYRDAPPGLRIWCGGTVEASDLLRLLPWLEWAFETQISSL